MPNFFEDVGIQNGDLILRNSSGAETIRLDGDDRGKITVIGQGVFGTESPGAGVIGKGLDIGVHGRAGRIGVRGESVAFGISTGTGAFGTGAKGVSGIGDEIGVLGESGDNGDGVLGFNPKVVGSASTFKKGPFVISKSIIRTKAVMQVINELNGGEAAWMTLTDASNREAVIKLVLPTRSNANFLEGHQPDDSRKFHINHNGTFVSGSDFAEALPAQGHIDIYDPGDVLVMTRDGLGVEKTSEACSNRIVGVYSTRPGILGAAKGKDTRVDPNDLPVAILGIVPTKVTSVNGPILVGDLLVTSSVPGYAMKAERRVINGYKVYQTGAILGKALESCEKDEGMIKVLIMLQ